MWRNKPKHDELAIPPIAASDPKSVEILRLWIAKGDQHISIRGTVWDDPAAWGICLSDFARHVANIYAESAGLDRKETTLRILEVLKAEMESPTDVPTGGLEKDS